MIIKPNHPYADPDGGIHVPYLDAWTAYSSLNELFKLLTQIFSAQPPLFQRPPAPVAVHGTVISSKTHGHSPVTSTAYGSPNPVTTTKWGEVTSTSTPTASVSAATSYGSII